MSSPPLDLDFTEKDHIVRAGAGAGKTYNLVECVVRAYRHFKEEECKTPRFVLTTFTRKATQELRERMILKACELDDPDFFNFVTDPGHLTISTIHGVLGQFLKEFGHLFGMDLSFKILEGEDEKLLLETAARELLISDEEHGEWLESFAFFRLLSMLASYHHHYGKNQELRPPTFEEALDHSQKFLEAQKNILLSAIEHGLSSVSDDVYLKSLRELKEFLELWESDMVLEMPSLPRKAKRESFPTEFHEEIGHRIKKFKTIVDEILFSPEELRSLSEAWEEFSSFALSYSELVEEKKTQGGFVTLSDLENQVHRILTSSPFLGRIFSENFDFWLIDEFQDTSSHQLSILNQLIGDRPRFVVGDPQQSIYLFRGAESQIFNLEWKRISEEEGKTSLLERNYRSDKDLLELFNRLMKASPQFSPMVPHKAEIATGPVAHFLSGEDLEDELKGIYQRASELCGESEKWDEICVLGRTHDDLFKVASYLKSKGVPTHVHSPLGYASRREVQDALSIYKFLINPHDDLNLLQILRAPWLKVSDLKLKEWAENRSEKSLWARVGKETHPSILLLAEAQEELGEKGLIKTYTDFLLRIQFIEKSAVFDPSGRVEANIWKLVQLIRDSDGTPGRSPLDVLESLSGESDAVAAMEPNCVNLMTIHGSKGLEFDHVFFPRLGRRFQTSKRGAISFSPNSSRFVFSLKDEDDLSLVSSLEKEWIENQKQREKEEVERWFYVALTRAKKTITLSWNEKEMNSESWVGLFDLLTFEFPGVVRLSGPFPETPPVRNGMKTSGVRSPYEDGENDSATLVRSSFSEISADEVKSWNPKIILNKFLAQAEGIHWHRLFENIRFHDLEKGLEPYPFLKDMVQPPFREILNKGHVEWGFQAKRGLSILEGQIDLWGYDPQGNLWVIDYKTGSSKEPEKAVLQVQFYLWILREKGIQAPCFKWAVIYPFEEKVIQGEMLEKDFESVEIELGLSERAGH